MTSRERVLAALEHREPDRVPVDLGGTIMSGIAAQALDTYLAHLERSGVPLKGVRPVKVYELYQMLAEVEPDVVDHLGVDVLPVEPDALFFDISRSAYKEWELFDGTTVRVPSQFNVEVDAEGGWILHEQGDATKPAAARMPRDGYYFDMIADQSLHMDFEPPPLSEMERRFNRPLPSQKIEFVAQKAEKLRPTQKALILGMWLDFGPPSVGSTPDWLCLMSSDPEYVEQLFRIKAEGDLRRLEQLAPALRDYIDIYGVDGADFGTQRAELFSPELFERFHFPYYSSVIGYVHENLGWKTWKHSCGSIVKLLPYLIRSGLDAINPVQTSAAGMEPEVLKEKFGADITFWGGGVDTQRTLPFGSPEDVYQEVTERLRAFGRGGGFVFNTVHNVQAKTPPENLDAMFRAIKDHG